MSKATGPALEVLPGNVSTRLHQPAVFTRDARGAVQQLSLVTHIHIIYIRLYLCYLQVRLDFVSVVALHYVHMHPTTKVEKVNVSEMAC